MKLSIITINKNNASGLRQTISSVLNQTYQGYEYLIIDGASSDGSIDVIKDQLNNTDDSRPIHWISEEDSGIYAAMNKGIRMATGEYLLFLNSGDVLANNNVLETADIASFHADIAIGKCNIVRDDDVVWTYIPHDYYTFGSIFSHGIAHQSSFIRKELFDTYGLYDETYKYNGDIEFWYRTIIDNGASTQAIHTIITNYRLGGISDTQKNNPDFKEEHQRILSNPRYQRFIPDYEQWEKDKAWIKKYQLIERYPSVMRLIRYIEKAKKRFSKPLGK